MNILYDKFLSESKEIETFVNDVMKSSLTTVFQCIRKYKIILSITNNMVLLYKEGIKIEEASEILSYIAMRYRIDSSKFTITDGIIGAYIHGIDDLHNDLTRIWMVFGDRPNTSYNDMVYGCPIHLDYIASIIRRPREFSAYYVYSLTVMLGIQEIVKHRLYPLYTILNKYRWMIFTNDDSYILVVKNIKYKDRETMQSISSAIGTDKVFLIDRRRKWTYFYTTDTKLGELLDIDTLFHPFIPVRHYFY